MADAALQDNIDKVVRRSDLDGSTYTDTDGRSHLYPMMGQGPAKLVSAADLERDELGFTNPNLHRRVDPQDPLAADDERNQEVAPRGYQLNVQNVHSYRTTTINVHDEDSIYAERP